MQIGSPKLLKLKSLSKKISTTGLRYLKVALEMKELFGTNIGNVVEIGCGYGGQAIILDQLLKVNSYTFYDLWQVNLLIKRFIELSSFNAKYSICTLKKILLIKGTIGIYVLVIMRLVSCLRNCKVFI